MTALNCCPICGIEMYSFDRAMEMACEESKPPLEEMTEDHIKSAIKQLRHAEHAHLVTETRPGVYSSRDHHYPA